MLRVVVPALLLSACAYDYDGAFGGTGAGGAAIGTGVGGTGAGASGAGGAPGTTAASSTTSDGPSSTASEAASSTSMMPCACAFPGTCDGNNNCVCPAQAVVERYATITDSPSTGFQGWFDVANAAAPDALAARVRLDHNQVSEQLTAHGFDFAELPLDATILGVRVEYDRCRTVVNSGPVHVEDIFIQLASANVAVGAQAAYQTWNDCSTGGGPWGYEFPVTGVTAGHVKNDFMAVLRIKNTQTEKADGWVNSVWMRVTYAPTCIP